MGGTSTFPDPGNKNKTSFKGLVIGIQATQKTGTSKLEHIPHISLARPADQLTLAYSECQRCWWQCHRSG